MFKYLPSNVYAKLIDVIDNGASLDRSIANAVADGMKNGPLNWELLTTLTGSSL